MSVKLKIVVLFLKLMLSGPFGYCSLFLVTAFTTDKGKVGGFSPSIQFYLRIIRILFIIVYLNDEDSSTSEHMNEETPDYFGRNLV